MAEKMIVWALFDSETATVSKALPEHKVYSFGVGGGTQHINLDLSDFKTAKRELDNYPRPDVIFASPPCESWVRLSVGAKRHFTKAKGLNYHWHKKVGSF
jgi:site-specific DNA-cytosine methylase